MAGDSGKGLLGRQVLVPSSVWPKERPPPGKKGWGGVVQSLRTSRPETYFVRFPDDAETYWFAASDLKKWLAPEGCASAPASKAAAPAAKPPASPAKRKLEEAAAAAAASPDKKAKAAAPTSPAKVAGLTKPLPPRPAGSNGRPHGGRTVGSAEEHAAAMEDLNAVLAHMDVDKIRALIAYAKRHS